MRGAVVSAPGASALGAAFLAIIALLASDAGAAQVHRVTIEGMKFVPERVEARAGDTIVWKNLDLVPHTATAAAAGKSKPLFDSGMISQDKKFKLTIRASMPDELSYICLYHPTMKGVIAIKR